MMLWLRAQNDISWDTEGFIFPLGGKLAQNANPSSSPSESAFFSERECVRVYAFVCVCVCVSSVKIQFDCERQPTTNGKLHCMALRKERWIEWRGREGERRERGRKYFCSPPLTTLGSTQRAREESGFRLAEVPALLSKSWCRHSTTQDTFSCWLFNG